MPVVVVHGHGVLDPEDLTAAVILLSRLEGELGRLHADDDEAVVVVSLVPGLHVGERSLAVDARVGPEVHQHDLPAQALQRQRLAALRVEPCGDARELRRGPALGESLGIAGRGVAFARGERAVVGFGVAQLVELVEGERVPFDVVLERVGVARDELLHAAGEIEAQGDAHHDEQRAAYRAQMTRAPGEAAVAFDQPVPGQRDAEQGHRRAGGEDEAQQQAVETDAVVRPQGGNGRQHRSRTGHEHRAQAQAEEERGPSGARRRPGEAGEGSFKHPLESRDQESHPEEEQQHEAEVSQQILWQTQGARAPPTRVH